MENWVSGAIPYSGFFRQMQQIISGDIKRPRGLAEAAKTVIPGLSKEVAPKRDVFGDPITIPADIRRATPYVAVQQDPEKQKIVDELQRLDINIGFPSRKIEGIELTSEQYDQYTAVSGNLIKEIMLMVVNDPEYLAMSDEEKTKLIDSIKSGARKRAKDAISSTITSEQLQNVLQPKKSNKIPFLPF
jgi:hypothetical protein